MDARTRLAARTGDRAAYLRELLRSQDSPCGECRPVEASEIKQLLAGKVQPAACFCAGTGLRLHPLVELAAYCGDDGAREALGSTACCWTHMAGAGTFLPCLDTFLGFPAWLRGLSRWGHHVLVRAALAAGEVALEKWEPGHLVFDCVKCAGSGRWCPIHQRPAENEDDFHPRPRRDVEYCERSEERCGIGTVGSFHPEDGDDDPVDDFHQECPECFGDPASAPDPAPRRALEAARAWVECPCEEHREAWREAQVDVVEASGVGTFVPNPEDPPHVTQQRITKAANLAGEAPIRAAIQSALIAWALGWL